MEFAELTGKQKLVFEACVKIQLGEKYMQEGQMELKALIGDDAKKGHHKKDISTFHHDKRSDEIVMAGIVKVLRVNRQASTQLLKQKLHISDRRLDRVLTTMSNEKTIDDIGGGGRHAWVLNSPAKPRKKSNDKTEKTVANKTTRRGTVIDHTDEKYQEKAINFLKTHDWVNKGQLIEAVDLSPGPANRLFAYMQNKKLIKVVKKPNNPAHIDNGNRRLYNRPLPYFEIV